MMDNKKYTICDSATRFEAQGGQFFAKFNRSVVLKVPRCRDMVFLLTVTTIVTMTEPITLPLAHARMVTIYNLNQLKDKITSLCL